MYLFIPIYLRYKHNIEHSGKIIVMFNDMDNRVPLQNTVKGVIAKNYEDGAAKMTAMVRDIIMNHYWWSKDVSVSDFELIFSDNEIDENGEVWTSTNVVGSTRL